MLVDDSAVVRGLISRALEADPYISVVSSVHNGEAAVNAVTKARPDIIILDIEMPVMDGLTALPLLLEKCPSAKIIMCSTLTEKGAAISMKALSLGATEYICKPSSTKERGAGSEFQKNIVNLVKTLAGGVEERVPRESYRHAKQREQAPFAVPRHKKEITLRDSALSWDGKPSVIAIGSSTGGPKALFEVIMNLRDLDIPVAVTQHMPATFTKILAQHIDQQTGVPCREGENGMIFQAGHVYIAPGGYHLKFEKKENNVAIRLDEGAPENFCKPSVDPMMHSLVEIYEKKILGIMLTGMGADGLQGSRKLVESGGTLIAQDQESSVVWGMPGAVATQGLCTAVLPLNQIGPWVRKKVLMS